MTKVFGGLLVVAADLAECSGFFGTNSIPEIRGHLSEMELHAVPDAMSLPSLSAGYLKTGDCLALPMSAVVVTKAINGDHVGLRNSFIAS